MTPSEIKGNSLDRRAIEQVVFQAVGLLNQGLAPGEQLRPVGETILYGKGSPLDSLALAAFVVDVEDLLRRSHGRKITLADEKAMSARNSPFRSIAFLIDYIMALLAETDTSRGSAP